MPEKFSAKGLIVSIYDLLFSKLDIFMLVLYVNSRLNLRSEGEGRELPPTTAWRQFPALLSAPVVEPRVLSRNTGNRDSE